MFCSYQSVLNCRKDMFYNIGISKVQDRFFEHCLKKQIHKLLKLTVKKLIFFLFQAPKACTFMASSNCLTPTHMNTPRTQKLVFPYYFIMIVPPSQTNFTTFDIILWTDLNKIIIIPKISCTKHYTVRHHSSQNLPRPHSLPYQWCEIKEPIKPIGRNIKAEAGKTVELEVKLGLAAASQPAQMIV